MPFKLLNGTSIALVVHQFTSKIMRIPIISTIVKAIDSETAKVSATISFHVLKMFKAKLLLRKEMSFTCSLKYFMDYSFPSHVTTVVEFTLDELDCRSSIRVMREDKIVFKLGETVSDKFIDGFK